MQNGYEIYSLVFLKSFKGFMTILTWSRCPESITSQQSKTGAQYTLGEQGQFYTSSDPNGKFSELSLLWGSIPHSAVPRNAEPLSALLILRVAAQYTERYVVKYSHII